MTAASDSDARKREAEKTKQAVRSQKSATRATNSPKVAGDASGVVGAILTSEQVGALASVLADHREDESTHCCYWHDGCGCGWDLEDESANADQFPRHLVETLLASDAFAAIVREHRAEALAEVKRATDCLHLALDDLIERLGDMNRAKGTDPTGMAHWQGYDQAAHECAAELTRIVRDYRQEQNHA